MPVAPPVEGSVPPAAAEPGAGGRAGHADPAPSDRRVEQRRHADRVLAHVDVRVVVEHVPEDRQHGRHDRERQEHGDRPGESRPGTDQVAAAHEVATADQVPDRDHRGDDPPARLPGQDGSRPGRHGEGDDECHDREHPPERVEGTLRPARVERSPRLGERRVPEPAGPREQAGEHPERRGGAREREDGGGHRGRDERDQEVGPVGVESHDLERVVRRSRGPAQVEELDSDGRDDQADEPGRPRPEPLAVPPRWGGLILRHAATSWRRDTARPARANSGRTWPTIAVQATERRPPTWSPTSAIASAGRSRRFSSAT